MRDPRVFRISCTLQEQVDPDTLNEALRRTAQEWPQFQVTLHRGLFWHYFESTDLMPAAQPETKAPCAPLYTPERRNRLIYRVTYFGARINLEMFHAITDGNGGLLYLKSIVRNYLALRHPGELDSVPSPNSASAGAPCAGQLPQLFTAAPDAARPRKRPRSTARTAFGPTTSCNSLGASQRPAGAGPLPCAGCIDDELPRCLLRCLPSTTICPRWSAASPSRSACRSTCATTPQ